MALPVNITAMQLQGNVIGSVLALRRALQNFADLYGWTSQVTLSDLTGPAPGGLGMDSATAQAILTAVADGNAVYQLFTTGLPPSTYPQPSQAYVYASSQRALAGPALPG